MTQTNEHPVVALLGTGLLGGAIAINLARHGFAVRVWNRTFGKAQRLEAHGCTALRTLADTVAEADFVITVLADGPTTEDVLLGTELAGEIRPPAIVLQLGTVGEATTATLARAFFARGIGFIDCPVSGSREPALAGELVMLASGDPALRATVEPLLDAMGRKTIWSNTIGDGTRLKLAINSWLGLSLHALSEVVGLCRITDIDPEAFFDAIASGPLDMPYAQTRGHAMSDRRFTPAAFPLQLLVKDLELALASTELRSQGAALPALLLAKETATEVCEAGYGDEDMTAIARAIELRRRDLNGASAEDTNQ